STHSDELARNLDDPKSAPVSFSAEVPTVFSALDGDSEDDFNFFSGSFQGAPKLDLAFSYIYLGDS
ncbi:hypothetical protein ACV35P_34850, partial [Pseudomonas aeruginosa]